MDCRWKKGIVVLLATLVALTLSGIGPCFAAAKEKVTIFHAGSLSKPFARIEREFEALYPNLDVVRESGGSRKMARMISEKHRPADLMASADYKVIDNLLIPDYADWNIRFASNQLVLCYTAASKRKAELNADSWREVLADKDIRWGHTDPNLDPCGYRSLMVLQLAEKYYADPGLYDRLVAARSPEHVYGSAADMVKELKEDKIDYAWEYLSVAVQNNLEYLTMPAEINLGDYKHAANYQTSSVEVTGKKAGTKMTLTGDSITYGITMTKNPPNPEGARLFLEYLLNADKGLRALQEMGQVPMVPAQVDSQAVVEKLPKSLAALVGVSQ